MPKYTVQNGTVIVPKDPKDPKGDRLTLKVGDELELTKAQAEKMDRDGHYLCLSSEFGKPKKPAKTSAPSDEEVDEDEDLEDLTKPGGK